MKIALIGYGKMGKAIETIALGRHHEISCRIDAGEEYKFDSAEFKNSEVAIEFTTPQSALSNYYKAFESNVPVVSGTTGWLDHLAELKDFIAKEGKTFFYASNFSLGVNVFFAVNRYLAKLMNNFPDYNVEMHETHHIHKKDAPSGTAITLAEGIIQNIDKKDSWTLDKNVAPNEIHINSIREGEVPGRHTITYYSDLDTIQITHDAKSRKGFALGAVIAAEFLKDKKGFYGMDDLLKF